MLPAALLSLTNIIDSVWTISVQHADLAGKELAKALMLRPQGSRPVTLVGYSMGARVIFSCLCELFKLRYGYMMRGDGKLHKHQSSSSSSTAKRKPSVSSYLPFMRKTDTKSSAVALSSYSQRVSSDSTADAQNDENSDQPSTSPLDDAEYDDIDDEFFNSTAYESAIDSTFKSSDQDIPKDEEGKEEVDEKTSGLENIVQDVVLLGCPVRYKSKFWKWVRMMVSGRFINGYSKKDIILGLVYR
jgi:hypothetical protein